MSSVPLPKIRLVVNDTLHTVSQETLEWAQEAVVRELEELYDDPAGFGDPQEAADHWRKLVRISAGLGIDWHQKARGITDFERSRMETILAYNPAD